MKLHEYQAKEFFTSYGIPVENHVICYHPTEVPGAFQQLKSPKAVIKAQVLTGGRGKAGGIKITDDPKEAYRLAQQLFGMNIKGYTVDKVLVSEAVSIASEYYVSLAIDRNTRSVLLMMSTEGGMDIEEVAKRSPEKIHRFQIDPLIGLPDYLARKFAFLFFSAPSQVNRMAFILQRLYKLFIEKDASLAEINPLVLTDEGKLMAIDAKLMFDDNALYRQQDVAGLQEKTEDEKTEAYAHSKGFSYVRMDGEIGCMVNGAGLAMATMDMIKLYGGTPANFLDIGGSSNPRKIVDAMDLLLKDPNVKIVLINIFGGITRCDDVANGLLEAFNKIECKIPIIVRLTGTNDKEGRRLLNGSQFIVVDTMKEATHKAVELSNSHKKSIEHHEYTYQ